MTTTSSAQHNSHKVKERGKSTTQTLSCGGVGYHMMLSEYIDMNNLLPTLSSEVVHRVVEILKFFNTRTCQLILGAGAMQLQVSSSQHLLSWADDGGRDLLELLLQACLFLGFLLVDFKVHQEEILTKVVQIMRERVLSHLRKLPPVVERWNIPVDTDSQPSLIAKEIVKMSFHCIQLFGENLQHVNNPQSDSCYIDEVNYLQRILSRTLHEADIQAIFRQVVIDLHKETSEAFSKFEISSPQAKGRLHRDITLILECIRSLPSGSSSKFYTLNRGQLDEFFL
ncbi:VACUOLAR PROTEIN SORTING 54 [Salix koriyanagi]|uniref:VACUOLAR PROTEIN SORTING 54 n=1 Tax=Salix koriyanagi TaxID=2511006 RepID=A0A9Q1AMK2_9ROSI|nr:VACUOLAR PROTEIN SORTING 54 [Salix koriyanagi]